MARETVLEGVLAINKPMGLSSAQVIRDCQTYFNPSAVFQPLIQHEAALRAQESNAQHRRRSKAKRDMRVKMGHGGTLDPLATGVLILGVGRGTKELPRFLSCTKTYETVVLFGASTDTYDRVGRILKRRSYGDLTRASVEAALAAFRGTYQQMPPLYSALKMNGKPLYEYARAGLSIPREIETREVTVSALDLVEWYAPGTHPHRWPAEEAGVAEQTLAERVWRVEKDQAAGHTRSAEEDKSDRAALAAHEDFKRKVELKQDELVYDRPSKRRRGGGEAGRGPGRDTRRHDESLLMSGALGEMPGSSDNAAADRQTNGTPLQTPRPGRGSNLVPPPPAPNTPPPWEGEGPPAARIRMTVSTGFYVRSFCHDLGEKLGSAAMMAELARVRQGDFVAGSANCLEYDDVLRGEAVWGPKVERLLALWKSGDVAKAGEQPAEDSRETVLPTPDGDGDEPDGRSVGTASEWNGFSDAAAETPAETPAEDKNNPGDQKEI